MEKPKEYIGFNLYFSERKLILMRSFYLFVSLLLFVVSCKKSNNNNNSGPCTLRETRTTYGGSPAPESPQTHEYDNQGRIVKITNPGFTSTYAYYTDSLVITGWAGNRTVYFLNQAGLADSSKVRYVGAINEISLEDVYTYDADGFLVQQREIFSQLYNGNILRDTFFFTYTILNGNIVKSTYTNAPEDDYYEYSTLSMPDNNPRLNIFPSAAGKFLGKAPANLVSKVKTQAGNILSTFSYSFDLKGNVSKRTTVDFSPATNSPIVNDFKYDCN